MCVCLLGWLTHLSSPRPTRSLARPNFPAKVPRAHSSSRQYFGFNGGTEWKKAGGREAGSDKERTARIFLFLSNSGKRALFLVELIMAAAAISGVIDSNRLKRSTYGTGFGGPTGTDRHRHM